MRVALIYDNVYPYIGGGAERRHHAIASEAAGSHKITIYALNYWSRDPRHQVLGATYVSVGPVVPIYDARGRRTLLQPFLFAFGLFWALLRSREEVWDVLSFPYVSVPVARVLSAMKRRPIVVTWLEYWGDYWYEYLGPLGAIGKLLERLALRCSPRIVAISAFTKRRLVAAGAPADRITIVPNGVDVQRIAKVIACADSSDLIYVGRLVEYKQVHLLIEAVALLHVRRSRLTLHIIGDGPERQRLEQRAGALGLGTWVKFLGSLPSADDVYAYLKASRVLVLPSRREGFGTVVIEAWACGLPVVVCDEPGNATVELIDLPAKGRIVPSRADAIADACATLIAVGDDGQVDRKVAATAFDWPIIVGQMFSVYGSLLATELPGSG